jgi:hypothetical protein
MQPATQGAPTDNTAEDGSRRHCSLQRIRRPATQDTRPTYVLNQTEKHTWYTASIAILRACGVADRVSS